MKVIKTRLCNRLGELSLSYLMKIAIESPETLYDSNLEVITIWNRKCIRIAVKIIDLLSVTVYVYNYVLL